MTKGNPSQSHCHTSPPRSHQPPVLFLKCPIPQHLRPALRPILDPLRPDISHWALRADLAERGFLAGQPTLKASSSAMSQSR